MDLPPCYSNWFTRQAALLKLRQWNISLLVKIPIILNSLNGVCKQNTNSCPENTAKVTFWLFEKVIRQSHDFWMTHFRGKVPLLVFLRMSFGLSENLRSADHIIHSKEYVICNHCPIHQTMSFWCIRSPINKFMD